MSAPTRADYQIGWICALPIEAAAAKEMLDESFGLLDEQEATDPNVYTLGRIGKHNVVIACLPAGQYGSSTAAIAASHMIRSFSKSLRIGLMVGVGGGIPSDNHDIRLGDIVISCPTNTCGGVIQYDMGKYEAGDRNEDGGKFHRTGSLNSPPKSLLTAVNSMRAAAITDDPRYLEYLEKAIMRTDRTKRNFGRPSEQSDRLFKIEHEHPSEAADCTMCLIEREIVRHKREDNNPQPHYGIIASGNSVIKHGTIREQLRLETGALCFEMEAAGLMLDFPCIVIRGICDYSDSHKHKQWQGYAALAAAAYAKELLEYLPRGQVSRESLAADIGRSLDILNEQVKGTKRRLDQVYDQQERHHREKTVTYITEKQRQCHRSFKTLNYEQHKEINPDRALGTCQWVFQNENYIRWRDTCSNGLLWISADPGCGKSVLAKSLIDNELPASQLSLCYFFFKDNDEQNNITAALCAILHQLFSQETNLIEHAIPSWERNGNKLQYEAGELWRTLMAVASSPKLKKQIVCIFDALDECDTDDQGQLIQNFNEFHRRAGSSTEKPGLKFLITSRPYLDIEVKFRDITEAFPHIHLQGENENDQIQKEIDIVVKVKVQELAKAANLTTELRDKLERQLLQMKHRTYLWLYLAIDAIRNTFHFSFQPSKESIEMVPPSVNAAYEKLLARVPEKQADTVKKILQIIVGARRPLTVDEMAMALGIAVAPESRTTTEAMLDAVQLSLKIRHLCGLFVFISNSQIYLLHQTAREFLISKELSMKIHKIHPFTLTDAEALLGNSCVRYLIMDDLDDLQGQLSSNPRIFLKYSAQHWADHVRSMTSTANAAIHGLICRLYETSTRNFLLWFPIFYETTRPLWYSCRFILNESLEDFLKKPIPLAAFNGDLLVLRRLVLQKREAKRLEVNSGRFEKEDRSSVPSCDVVPQRHSQASSIQQPDEDLRAALIYASWNGYEEICYFIVECGVDAVASALVAASAEGHNNVVRMFLAKGASLTGEGFTYMNALQAACGCNHIETVKFLLENGANINDWGDSYYGSPIQAASGGGHLELVQFLLKNGANPRDSTCGQLGSALLAASYNGFHEVVKQLLEAGADSSYDDEDYGHALYVACGQDDLETVRVLVQQGADVNLKSHYGTALTKASSFGHLNTVRFLLENGADVNGHGRILNNNALVRASYSGYCEIVGVLLEAGANIHAEDERFGNAITAASSMNHIDVMQILLKHGANVNAQTREYGTALMAATIRGHEEVVKLLISLGADMNARCSQHGTAWTALRAARYYGRDDIERILLDHGAVL